MKQPNKKTKYYNKKQKNKYMNKILFFFCYNINFKTKTKKKNEYIKIFLWMY